jgi:hypothetical protein
MLIVFTVVYVIWLQYSSDPFISRLKEIIGVENVGLCLKDVKLKCYIKF